ncbi:MULTISPECIES: prepilin peptidase [Bacteria]|uniref:prepilin peptidase n=1 Tax=Bacteria TaxID=2 RepID=UPI003C7B8E4F
MDLIGVRTLALVVVHVGLLFVALALIAVDIAEHRLPDRIVLPVLGVLLLLVVADAVGAGSAGLLRRAVLGALLLAGLYAALRMLSRGGMGGGDVKLAAVIGLVLAWHGWRAFVVGAAAAFVLGALAAAVLLLARRADRETRIAFGPWMILGAVIGIPAG